MIHNLPYTARWFSAALLLVCSPCACTQKEQPPTAQPGGTTNTAGSDARSKTAVTETSIAAFEQSLTESWSGVKSVSANILMESNAGGGALKVTNTTDGTVELLRSGDAMLYRADTHMTTTTHVTGQQPEAISADILTVQDDLFLYAMNRQGELVSVVKLDAQPSMIMGGPGYLEVLRSRNSITVAGREDYNGVDCWVIDAAPLKREPSSPIETRYYFRCDTGLVTSIDVYGENGVVSSTRLSDIQFNTQIDPQRFHFLVPPGIEVLDRSSTGDNSGMN